MSHHDIVITRPGAAKHLELRQIAPRPPADDEVSIDVAYSGINFADIAMRLGFYPDAPKRPFVPGYEVSGKVTAVGKSVTGLAAGDAVIAGTYFGGYASSVTIPSRQVFKLPPSIDLQAGAALPVAYFTARLAMFEMARVREGDKVLIECATGGVGVIATQMARHAGAEVTGLTTSPHKKAFIEQLGAKAFTVDEFRRTELDGYDMILNAAAGPSITWQRARLGLTGRMVCIGLQSAMNNGKRDFVKLALAAIRTPRISVFKLFDESSGIYGLNALHVLRDPNWIEKLTASLTSVERMGLAPHVGKVFPATDVAAAHAFLETKQATGKVLLAWS